MWILSEAREDTGERAGGVDSRLNVNDVANELNRILRKEGDVEMQDVQDTAQVDLNHVITID
jgi:hypothetical protein